ncbi:hypothetical protein [Novosphingobium sp.]|uniref:hypothetical protein n=1 Tax=Novosphingobium sp. TaxID=1874826 RepID=UPI00286E40FC|nr:hypothetical protein [Novosphingobium sp.]
METKQTKSKEELEEALLRQILNFRRSAKHFDEGALEEAERLASVIYILCDESRHQRSLLRSLNLRNVHKFPDTGMRPKGNTFYGGPPLLRLWKEGGEIVCYVPALSDTHFLTELHFRHWWEQAVFTNSHGRDLSRKELVFRLRSQDGGGHVDKDNKGLEYIDFKSNKRHHTFSADLVLSSSTPNVPLINAHWLTMRQIAWEVDWVLKKLGY